MGKREDRGRKWKHKFKKKRNKHTQRSEMGETALNIVIKDTFFQVSLFTAFFGCEDLVHLAMCERSGSSKTEYDDKPLQEG